MPLLPSTWTPPAEEGRGPPPPPPVFRDGHTPPHLQIYQGLQAVLTNQEELARRLDRIERALDTVRNR
jgi:hypothetical protein